MNAAPAPPAPAVAVADHVDVDVLMPARDIPAPWLARAMKSTLRSRGVRLRVVLVDHGSQEPIAVDPRWSRDGHAAAHVEVVRVEASVDFAAALAAGLSRCTARFVARMDADDVMHPDRLRLQLQALLDDERLGAVGSRVKVLPRTTTAMRGYVVWQNALLAAEDHARDVWVEQPLCNPATTFRRAALDAVGGYVVVDGPEDYDLFLRLHRGGWHLAKLVGVHHGWRQHPQQTTRTQPTHTRDKLAALKARHLVAHFGLAARTLVVAGAGKEGRRIARALRAAGATVGAFVDLDPRKIGRRVHDAPVEPLAFLASRPADAFVVGAVGTSGARGVVRAQLRDAGLIEGGDAVVVT